MTHRPRPDGPADHPEDELIRRALDGELGPDELARVASDPRLGPEIDRQRAAIVALGAPVDPLPATAVDRMVASALAAGSSPAPATAHHATDGDRPEAEVTTLARHADSRRTGRPAWIAWAAAAAVLVALVGLGAALARTTTSSETADRSTASDSAASLESSPDALEDQAAGGEAATSESQSADDFSSANRSSSGAGFTDLGDLGDAASVGQLVDRATQVSEELSVVRPAAPPQVTDGAAQHLAAEDVLACLAQIAPDSTLYGWGRGRVEGRVVDVALVVASPSGERRALAVAQDCAIELERPI